MTKNLDAPADVSLRSARALSRLLFAGAHYRVEIGAAIADDSAKPVNTAELAEELNLSRQSVNRELQLLESVGLLIRVEQDSGRKVYFLMQKSTYWAWCQEARTEAAAMLDRVDPY
jgi:predicted transcriptional regulator